MFNKQVISVQKAAAKMNSLQAKIDRIATKLKKKNSPLLKKKLDILEAESSQAYYEMAEAAAKADGLAVELVASVELFKRAGEVLTPAEMKEEENLVKELEYEPVLESKKQTVEVDDWWEQQLKTLRED